MKGVELHCTWIGKIMAGTLYSTLFLMFTLTWITEKELKRVIENKRDEFCRKKNMKIQSGCETMRNASGQQGENERQ